MIKFFKVVEFDAVKKEKSMNNNLVPPVRVLNDKRMENCIYNIRGQQVMLDSDVAYFFGIETKNLNKQMKRNINRFPDDFCFQLNS